MKNFIQKSIICPHCGHHVPVTLDSSNGSQEFYDDCPACCNPIHMNLMINEQLDIVELQVDADDEQIF